MTSINLFAPLPLRIVIFTGENVGEWETERTRKSSLRLRIRIFTRGNVGELETTNLLKSLRGHVQPRGLMSASWVPLGGLLGASWGAPVGHLGSQNAYFYTDFISHFASGRFWGCKAASTSHSCFLSASWKPPGSPLEASWKPLGVLLGAIWGLKMCIFTKVL